MALYAVASTAAAHGVWCRFSFWSIIFTLGNEKVGDLTGKRLASFRPNANKTSLFTPIMVIS
jgi:hypothetical protein